MGHGPDNLKGKEKNYGYVPSLERGSQIRMLLGAPSNLSEVTKIFFT